MAQKMAQWNVRRDHRPAKTHPDYWRERLQRRSYKGGDGQVVEMPEWHVRIAFRGRREWFNLETPNQAAAATKARDIYLSLISVWMGSRARETQASDD